MSCNTNKMTTKTHNIAAGIRLTVRNEDFLVTDVKKDIVEVEGITELYTAYFGFGITFNQNII